MYRRTTILAALSLLVFAFPDAFGQRNREYEFEIAVLPSVTYVFRSIDRERDYWSSNDPDSYTVITVPGFAPALRVSVWSVKPVVLDFGITVLESESERGVEESQLMLETGIGMDFGRPSQRVRPFGGILVGMMPGDLGELGGYVRSTRRRSLFLS